MAEDKWSDRQKADYRHLADSAKEYLQRIGSRIAGRMTGGPDPLAGRILRYVLIGYLVLMAVALGIGGLSLLLDWF